ncbi:hypothetical protein M407DRAFT_72199 [Tulasnella calospora MUT 4182]|uniref:T-cell immunomodulatory protein TIP C2 domain-containing protein n=1 Tax=Tulasnella calospora MUT 4182 TaxID=1051891 RepID=A0A0C3QKY7_9AGAM|nr:hypothetical protein M407DRAFT_72199 [Tulasnella calospora MUT 4182]
MTPRAGLLLLSLILPFSVHGFVWPFSKKRFTSNGLIGAGPLGLQDVDGRVAAFGDFGGDQFLDVVTLSEDQRTLTLYNWDHDQFRFTQSTSISVPAKVLNVVPGDFTHDGKLDLLVMSQASDTTAQLDIGLYVGTSGGLTTRPISVPRSTLAQPIPIDTNGDMKIDLLGLSPSTPTQSYLRIWQNTWDPKSPENSTLFTLVNPSFTGNDPCELADPHSSAVLDFDGDCLADLFMVCKSTQPGQLSYQIWLNDKSGSFRYSQGGLLPQGAGPVTFADMDRDGTMDMVFPTCTSVSSTTGVGTDCYINIVYNKQKPLCSNAAATLSNRNCRLPENLCSADPSFTFDFTDSADNDGYVRFPLSDLMQNLDTDRIGLLIYDTTYNPPLPLGIKVGDADLDGFPDILPIIAHNGNVYGISTTPWLLHSVPCNDGARKKLGKCPQGRRYFEPVTKSVGPLEEITDARSVTFLDMDEDGTLDILVQRTGKQANQKITFIQNNFFHDAFFLKAIVLNGACNGLCVPYNSSEPRYHPFGVSYSGATYKYTVIDTTGRRTAAQVAQLPQTSYHSLQTPYSFFGLGRTNNYIENLFVGSTRHSAEHFINMEGVIPNSRVVIMPPATDESSWKRELYLRPGEWIPWVTLTIVIATVILGIVVFVLHLNEKREDELERRRALHHINFDAL